MDIERLHSISSAKERRASKIQEHIQQDEDALGQLGHSQELARQFSPLAMFWLAFSVLGTWSTLAQDLATGLANGGPVSILWGLVLVTFCNLCVAVSLGELLSAMPTALGQAYWTYRLWPTPTGRFLSYMCAWINTFGWWTLTASQSAFMTSIILSLKQLFDPDWAPANEGWVKFLLYLGITLFLTLINATSCRKDRVLSQIENWVGYTFLGLFFALSLGLLIGVGVHKNLSFQPAKFVFGTWINQTGWPSGVTWFTGLIQSAYGLTAFDACIHMVEELPNASKTGPLIVWMSVFMGAITGWMFMAVCLGTIQNLDSLLNANIPFVELCEEVMGLTAAATLISFFVISGVGQNIGLTVTSSRLTWGFARDGGIPFHRYFAVVDDTWRVPMRAVWLQAVLIGLIGVLYLFANTVLQAILSVSTIALTISYAIPIVTLLVVGRDKLPSNLPFRLGRYGMTCNIVSIIYCSITTVFFFFPSEPNPSASDMNWAIAVFGIMLIIALGFWFLQGRKSYLMTADAMFKVVDLQEQSGRSSIPDVRELDNGPQDPTHQKTI